MAEKTEKKTVGKVILYGARASFLSLFEMNKQTQEDGSIRETWKSNFLFPKDEVKAKTLFAKWNGTRMPVLQAVQAASREAKEDKWGAEAKWPKLKPEKVFWRDGDLENWDGYADNWYISSNAQPTDRPLVLTNRKDKDGKWIPAQPGGAASPYAGCYVNATIVIWAQDNKHGTRLNAQVKAVQFLRDGEAFGAAPTDPNEDFDEDDVSDEGEIDTNDDDDDNMV